MEPELVQAYIEILEKTNQQLGLWTNPYGVMVMVLTIFIAIIAIGVTIALYKHSKDSRDRASQFYEEQDKIIREKNESVIRVEEKLDELIKAYEKELKDTTNNKKEVQKVLSELKKEKAMLDVSIGPSRVLSNTFTGGGIGGVNLANPNYFPESNLLYTGNTRCKNCGRTYGKSNSALNNWSLNAVDDNRCPYCGNVN